MSDRFPILIRTAFGLEAVVAREVQALGDYETSIEDGRVIVEGGTGDVIKFNLWLRSAERVQVVLGRFRAVDFGELFDNTVAAPWGEWIPASGNIPVTGRSVRSGLRSVRNCQRIVKKAIVEALKKHHKVRVIPETGAEYPVDISIVKDEALLTLDTTGPGLHKRGYRSFITQAPIKETLAAALVQLSFWNRERPLWDPVCGSGTIPIEAALIATNRAPGLHRDFLCERWERFSRDGWQAAREAATAAIDDSPSERLLGTDIDSQALKHARNHAELAGVADRIHFQTLPLKEVTSARQFGCLIGNPPYGERMGEQKAAERVARELGEALRRLPDWSLFAITSDQKFESHVKKKADRRRKLYNGRIACTLYQFHGKRPDRRPRTESPTDSSHSATDRPESS